LIKKLVLTTLFLNLINTVFACVVNGSEQVYIVNENVHNSFTFEQCSSDIQEKFIELVESADGSINQKVLYVQGLTGIELKPKKMRIRRLGDVVASRSNLMSNKRVKIVTNNIDRKLLNLNEENFLESTLIQPTVSGIQNIKLTKSINGQHVYSQWIKVKTETLTTVAIAKESLSINFNGLDTNNIKFTQKYVESPSDYITDLEKVKYKRLNKPVSKGEAIKHSNLTSITVVKYGQPINVLVNHKGLNLKMMATPMQNGFLGDTIKLKNTKSNKIFFGKVTDINTARIEL
jgi:flagella basal body P-ring formation protein FlgA